MSDVRVDHACSAEFAAVFVSVDGVQADWVGGLVHQGTVGDSQHISAVAWVKGGAGSLIRGIATVVVTVAPPVDVNADTVVTLKLCGSIARAIFLVTGVQTVEISVTLPPGVDTPGSVGTSELVGGTSSSAVFLVPSISAVIIPITHPRGFNTQEVVALNLARGALDFVTVSFISHITTVIISVTLELPGDALSVLTQQLVLSGAVGGAVEFVRSVCAVLLCVTNPVNLDALAVTAFLLVGSTSLHLSLHGRLFRVDCPFSVLLADFSICQSGQHHHYNEANSQRHHLVGFR